MGGGLPASLLRWISVVALFVFLSGCGSEGVSNGTGLSVTPTSLSFSADQGAATPATRYINATISHPDAAAIAAGYPGDSSVPGWMSLSLTGSGSNWTVGVSITDTSLAPGTYHATVRVVIYNSGSYPLAYRDVSITYTVSASLGVSSSNLNFSYVLGSPSGPANQIVNITGTGINWTASADQSWVWLGTSSGIAPGLMAVNVNTSSLGIGTHNATITISDTGSADSVTINVTLTISAPAFSLSQSSLTFSGILGASVASQDVSIAVNNGDTITWTATPGAAWLSATASGSTPGVVTIGVDSSAGPLTAGTYNSSVSLSGSSAGTTLNATINVQFTVTNPAFSVNQASFTFSGINGTAIPSQTLDIAVDNGDDISWSAASAHGWLVISKTSGTNTPDSLSVSVDPSVGPIASGTHDSTITLTGTSFGYTINRVINVTLNLAAPTLSVTQSSILLGGSDGLDLSTRPLEFSVNTGANSYPWTVSLDDGTDSWLIADFISGSVSSTGYTANIDADRSSIPGGIYAGTATVSVTVNGDVLTSAAIPVTLNVESRRLFIGDNGIALASMPTVSNLSHSVEVKENLGNAVNWTASSDQAWLSVTSSGTTPDNLTVTADPAGLTTDTLYLATVTVSSSNAAITNSETIRIGFWVGSSDPASTDTLSGTYYEAVTDPIRPYVYVNNAGTGIEVYNVHTAALVDTISGVASLLGDMTVSTDGSMLWAVDNTNLEVVPVNLDTRSVGTAWNSTGMSTSSRLGYARPGGYGIVLVAKYGIGVSGGIHEATTGTELSVTFATGIHEVAVSLQSNLLCRLSACHDLSYSDFAGGVVSVGPVRLAGAGSNCKDVAVNSDGTRAYYACGSPYEFSVFDTATSPMSKVAAFPGDAYPDAVEIDSNGLIFGGANVLYGAVSTKPDVWIYDSSGVEQSNYYVSGNAKGIRDRQLVVSGDGLRMIAITNDPKIVFTTVGP